MSPSPESQTTITLSIAGRVYRMACGAGEEEHLRRLGQRLDAKITELRGSFGEIGDQRITVMAALTLADDLAEAEARVARLEVENAALHDHQKTAVAAVTAVEDAVAVAIERAASRIEGVAHIMASGIRP